MPRLSFLFFILIFVSCFNKGKQNNHFLQIYNCVLDYEVHLIRTCEQNYDDKFLIENIPKGIYIKPFPPFDTMPCITSLTLNEQLYTEFLNKQCIILNIKNIQDDIHFINPITHERVKEYLGQMKRISIQFDVSDITIKKAGVELTNDVKGCKNQFSNIYNFSDIFLNKVENRAVVFCNIKGHSEEKAAYFLRKLGDVWYLEIKEFM